MPLVARSSLVAAVLSGAVLLVLPATSFAADTYTVAVVDDAYDDGNQDGNAEEGDERRSNTLITAGDTVVWEWKGENQHTVTSRADAPMQFDSDAACGEDKTPCQTKGNRFAVTFDEPGTYGYYCKFHSDQLGLTGMTGTIEVQAPPEPSDGESGSSEPASEESSSEPEGSSAPPQEDPDPEPTSESASEPADEPDDPPDDGGRPPRRAAAPGFGVQDQPPDAGPLDPDPEVAPEAGDGPSFSPFPSAPDLSETEDMAVNVPSRGGGPSRGVVVGVAIASVIASAGAFGKVVLFGQPWG